MRCIIYLGKVLKIKMGIYLGRRNIGMPQELLDAAEVLAGFQ
jgi:hypothetical protein